MRRCAHERRITPQAFRILATAVLSGLSCWFSIHLTQTPCGIALIWPANGLLLAVLLTTRRRLWPAAVGLSFMANVTTAALAHHVPARALPLGCCNVIEVVAGAVLLRRVLGQTPDLSAPGAFARFLAIAGGLTPACCALTQAAILAVWWNGPFASAALGCFCAHCLGNSVVAPATLAILRVDRKSLAAIFNRERRFRTVGWLLLYNAVLVGVFSQTRYPLLFTIPPLLLGVVAEVGTAAIALCIPSLAAVSCLATTLGRGPFTINAHLGQFERIILVQLFVLAALMMSARVARMLRERQRAHATLQAERDRAEANQARFRLLTEHALDVVLQADRHGRTVYWSPSAERVFGRPPGILLGLALEQFVHPDDVSRLEAQRGQLLAGEVAEASMLYRTIHPRRGEVWIEARTRGLRDPDTGLPDGYVSIGRDVTERVKLEAEGMERERELERLNSELETSMRHLARARNQAEDASRAKTRFLAGVSHELRTPLNGVLGHAQLLQIGGGLRADQSVHVEAMLGAGKHLLTMINSVLDLSQIEADRLALNLEIVDVAALARDCLDLVGPSAAARTLDLRLDCAAKRVHATADSTRLRQILLNLVGNAIKFTARGSVAVRVSSEAMRVAIEVVDTGPGISAALRSRLFQDFERLDLDAVGTVEGAGLGLALSARLAALMSGSLGHSDNPGGGSVFRLELPAVRGEAPVAVPARPVAVGGHRLRVLVVDDVAMNRDIACAFLRSLGHEPAEAADGATAVELVRDGDYDVVVMDVRMPGVDGLEATRRIRALEGERSSIAIVALTAQAFDEQVEQCRRAGMDAHAAKPVTREALMTAIEAARAQAKRSRKETHAYDAVS